MLECNVSIREPIRFGVLGCGSISRKAMLPALSTSARATLVAVASRSRALAEEYAAAFNCEADSGYPQLLARSDIDAVYIALPIGLHAKWAIEAACASKHVLCEKTLATSFAETEQIVSACAANNVTMLEGFAYQFHPQHGEVARLVASGAIGQPLFFNSWFGFPPPAGGHRYDAAFGGGALLDAGTYGIHAARQFYRSEPTVLSALSHYEGGVDIIGSAHLRFSDRQSALAAFGFDCMYRNSYSVWGTEGTLTLSRAFALPPQARPRIILERQGTTEEYELDAADQFLLELEAFCDSVLDADAGARWAHDSLMQARTLEQVRLCAFRTHSEQGGRLVP